MRFSTKKENQYCRSFFDPVGNLRVNWSVELAGVDCCKVCLCLGNVQDTEEGVSLADSSLIQKN